jgi:hypothetical protein
MHNISSVLLHKQNIKRVLWIHLSFNSVIGNFWVCFYWLIFLFTSCFFACSTTLDQISTIVNFTFSKLHIYIFSPIFLIFDLECIRVKYNELDTFKACFHSLLDVARLDISQELILLLYWSIAFLCILCSDP